MTDDLPKIFPAGKWDICFETDDKLLFYLTVVLSTDNTLEELTNTFPVGKIIGATPRLNIL